MSPVVITYCGMLVGVLIIAWCVFEMSKRVVSLKKRSRENPLTWFPLKLPRDHAGTPYQDHEGGSQKNSAHFENETRAKQNGHYLESKK